MLTYEAALDHVLAAMPPVRPEKLPVAEAAGRFLAEAVTSSLDLPPFDNSAMDGYAVRAADVAAARPDQPIALRVMSVTRAGNPPGPSLAAGCACRIFTGAPLPPDADAVVMQEDTRIVREQEVEILDTVRPWEGVRFRGEELHVGDRLLLAGRPAARRSMESTLLVDSSAAYCLSDHPAATGWLWRRLTREDARA